MIYSNPHSKIMHVDNCCYVKKKSARTQIRQPERGFFARLPFLPKMQPFAL